jgi:hypothetical protein
LSFLSNRIVAALIAGTFAASAAQAATNPQINVSPKVRIVQKVDNSKLITRPNSHSARVNKYTDLGRVAAGTQFQHMFLVLQSSDDQEFALHTLLDAQQDKGSPNYHQWTTPQTFGQAFGAASSDIAQVTAWMQDAGFTIEKVTQSGRFIEFSGTSGAVEAAFHTEMHQYMANGEVRIGNATDISIPAALAPVVVGPLALDNFHPASHHTTPTKMVKGADGQFHPDTTYPTGSTPAGVHILGGSDYPVIFDSKPLLTAGINGAGVKIGILGQTDVLLSDISTYRYIFGLPPANPNIIVVGNDPGTAAAGDDVESDLDLEVSGANAPGATIDFYESGSSYFGGSVSAAGIQIIENNTDDIISISYGFGCEADLSAPELASLNYMWEQASSQGISVFVSSGDSGPDDCDDGASSGSHYSVDGLSSTPYNVAVGGTMFNEGTNTGATQYWGAPNTAPPYESALSYIPEIVWNEGAFDPYGNVAYGGIVAGTSGISIIYGTPSWQTGPGVPTTDPTPPKGTVAGLSGGPHRYLPDVATPAAGVHDGLAFCSEGNCLLNSSGDLISFYTVGGTSVSAPSFAGMQALINQANGGRQGLPNYYYYRLAAAQSLTNCNAATLPSPAGANCAFHDVQTGNNFIPSARNGTIAAGQYIGWTANPGYDLTVGLGSPDINNLATQWKSVTFNATTTAFTLTPTTGPSGQTENFTINVTPVSGSGTPTGQVSIIAQALFGAVGAVTLSSGSASGTFASAGLEALPAGTYNVYAHYAGDVTYGGSNSANIQVTIGTSATTIVNNSYYLPTTGAAPTLTTTFTYGQNVYIDSQVCNAAGQANGLCNSGTPTGAITYKLVNQANVTLPTLVSPLDSYDDAYFDAGLGVAGYDIKPNYPSVAAPMVLAPGTYTVNTSYNGDSTYLASTGTPFTIVVGPASEAITFAVDTPYITTGATVTLTASLAVIDAASGGAYPTGTVTFTDTTTNTVLGTGTLVNGAVVFSVAGKITTTGSHLITAAYSGDSNYNPVTSTSTTTTVTVGTGAASTVTLATTVGGIAATTSQVGQTVAIVATVPSPATGTVYFYDAGVLLGTGTLSTTTHTATRNQTTFTAGTHTLTATYGGSTTVASSTSAATTYIVTKNTPTLSLASQGTGATTVGVPLDTVLVASPNNSTTGTYNPAPTGTVNYLDGTTVLGSGSITYLSGLVPTYEASYTTTALKPGTHVLSGQYLGDANYGPATSNTETINIGLTTLALTLSGSNLAGGAPLTISATVLPNVANTATIGGTVTFYDGTKVIGTSSPVGGVATLVISTPALAPGVTHTISAVYSGDSNYYTSTSNSATVIFGITTLTLTSSATNVGTGTTFTLTGTIAPVSSVAPTGTVMFYDGTTLLGTATGPFAGGKATLATNVTALGAHTISAVYSGDANYIGSSSTSTITITAVTPGFSISVNPTSLTITRGNSGTIALSATVYGNYSGYGLTTISGLPANSSYIISNSPYVFSGVDGTQTYNVYITTQTPHVGIKAGGFLWLPALLLAGFLGLRRKQLSVRGRQLVVFAILLFGMLGATGCGNSGSFPGTATGTTTATVTMVGTGSNAASPNETATATVSITVQ